MAVLDIRNDDDAFQILQDAIAGKFDNEVLQLNFDSWPCIHLNVKGGRYHSTITYSMMKALIEYQKVIYRTYADLLNKGTSLNLSAAEKKSLEVVFKVKEGSSDLLGDAAGAMTEFAKGAVGKMDSKQILITVLGAGLIWGGYHLASTHMNNQVKIAENAAKAEQDRLIEQNRHEITLELFKNNSKLIDAANESEAAYTKFLVSVKDAETASVGENLTLRKADLEELAKPERQPTKLVRLDSDYSIISLKHKANDIHLTILDVARGKEFSAWIRAGIISIDETRQIANAFLEKKTIYLNVTARANDTVTKSADIIGVRNKANKKKLAINVLKDK